jgi:Ca-activated chloride channel family protein
MQIRDRLLLGAVIAALLSFGVVGPGPSIGWADVVMGDEQYPPPYDRPENPDDRGDDGAESGASPFLLRSTEVRALVTGPVAHVVVTQTWENPNRLPVDGLYIFPLPENAAVTDMRMQIGERLISSDMKRREEARAIYERARREGRLAGLLDQERANVFAQQVANLVAGARVRVILEFDHTVACEDGGCSWVFPTIVGPRFIPARQTDPGRIAPPVVGKDGWTGQRLDLTVDIEGGVPIRDLRSSSHPVTIQRVDARRARVVLDPGARLDRDVRVTWTVGGGAPEAGIMAWRDPRNEDEPGVFALLLQPPAAPGDEEAASRELVFVLDCSGSMRGEPLEAAKEVVRQALRAVRPGDTFQIIRFSERASGLGAQPLEPTPGNVQRALAYLDGLSGEGGTEMLSGIRAALQAPADPRRLRIVAFLTDGYIGNERDILAEVRRLLGTARLFAFGIGSSVNRFLLEGLAEEGRGAAAFLAPRETAGQMVRRFVERIDMPVLTDIRLDWEDVEVEDLEPALVPDLFAGQQVIVHGRYRAPADGTLVVTGTRMGRRWSMRIPARFPQRAEDHAALGRLWARARIYQLDRQLHDGHRDDVKEEIIALGLRHRLVTAWTSLVAVDSEVVNTTGVSTPVGVPVEMPQDVSHEGVFGSINRESVTTQVMAPAPQPAQGGLASGPALGFKDESVAEDKVWGLAPGVTERPATPQTDSRTPAGSVLGTPGAVPFTRLTLVRADDSRLVLEDDGELWRVEPHRRSLRAKLTAAELQTVRAALAAARPEGWSGREAGSRLVVEIAGRQWTVSLPSRAPGVAELVALLETRAR